MPSDNVFPIARRRRHPETVPPAEAGQRRFRWFVAGLGVVWAGVLAAGIAFTPFPAIWPLLALSALVIAAEHRFILFGDETSMSSSIVVILCSVTFWHDDAYLVGPMLVATCGGLLFQHLRSHSWAKICANAFGMALAASGSALAFTLSSSFGGIKPIVFLVVLLAGLAYWLINNAVVAQFLTCYTGAPYFQDLKSLVASDTSVVWFATAGSALLLVQPTPSWKALTLIALLAVGASGATSCSETGHGSAYHRPRLTSSSIGILALLGGGTLILAETHPTSWLGLAAFATSALAFGDSEVIPGSPWLNRVGFIICLVAVSSFSTALIVAVIGISYALIWCRNQRGSVRRSASSVAAIVTVSGIGTWASLPAASRWAGLIISGATALGIVIGSRLLSAHRQIRQLGFLTFVGVAVPARDDAVFSILAGLSAFALNIDLALGFCVIAMAKIAVRQFFLTPERGQKRTLKRP